MITREDLISQSVFDYVRDEIRDRGYPERRVEFREAFPYTLNDAQLTRSIVAVGFDFDDDGEAAEMGSDLKRRLYTVQFFIFGPTITEARNVANVVKFIIDGANSSGGVPLIDYGAVGQPEIDRLEVEGVVTDRQVIQEPEPWQENVWATTAKLLDTYSASLV